MRVQIGFLGESPIAACNRTEKRTLASMYAQVVKEIAPLSWRHTTACKVTRHDSDLAMRRVVPELEYAEVICLWHGLVDFMNFVLVILIVAVKDEDLVDLDGNLVLDLVFLNFIASKQ